MDYEWDEAKAASNLAKHGVGFEEALTVFNDALAVILGDEEHSGTEPREIVIGYSIRTGSVCLWSVSPRGR